MNILHSTEQRRWQGWEHPGRCQTRNQKTHRDEKNDKTHCSRTSKMNNYKGLVSVDNLRVGESELMEPAPHLLRVRIALKGFWELCKQFWIVSRRRHPANLVHKAFHNWFVATCKEAKQEGDGTHCKLCQNLSIMRVSLDGCSSIKRIEGRTTRSSNI